jgi:hypothetical protein
MTQPTFPRRSLGRTFFDLAPLIALLATAGLWIASKETDAPRPKSTIPALDNLSVGIKRAGHFHFTEDDVDPIVQAMAHAGIGNFICWIDPDTGALEVDLAFDHKPHLDIKPGSCPNPVNVNHGAAMAAAVVPMSLLGNAFDVTQVDISTVRLSPVILQEGAQVQLIPVHISYEDVGAPFEAENCGCGTPAPDGILDIAIHFDRAEMVDGFDLEAQPNNSNFPLKVTGMVKEGRAVFGTRDCIRILNH